MVEVSHVSHAPGVTYAGAVIVTVPELRVAQEVMGVVRAIASHVPMVARVCVPGVP